VTGLQSRICRVCNHELPLASFGVYNWETGARRHECRACTLKRRRSYEVEGYIPKPKAPPPVAWEKLYHRGTRCWCCRQDSRGEMLCKTCREAA